MNKFVIQNVESELYAKTVVIGETPHLHPVRWTPRIEEAIHFENEEEVEATITFSGAVIDWGLEELLIVVSE